MPATVDTLRNGLYQPVLDALKGGDSAAATAAIKIEVMRATRPDTILQISYRPFPP